MTFKTVSGLLRKEEWWLLGLWLFCAMVYLSSGTGSAVYDVFYSYLRFFSHLLVYLFVITRIAFYVDEKWSPSSAFGQRAKRFVFGDPATRSTTAEADLELVRGVAMLFFTLAIYTNLKVRIPFINPASGDAAFQAIDDVLFPGLAPVIEAWFKGSVGVNEFFVDIYMHGYRYMMVLVLLVHLRRDTFSLRWLMASVCFVYLLAILVTAMYPSLGPCFLEPERFTYTRGAVSLSQHTLARGYMDALDAVASGRHIRTMPFYGVAAFPSLHVGHMIIMLVVALRVWRPYAWFMVVVAFLTFLATIGFGWHYVCDAPGGLAIAWGVTYLLGRQMGKWDRERATG
jgi:hypothetical protein